MHHRVTATVADYPARFFPRFFTRATISFLDHRPAALSLILAKIERNLCGTALTRLISLQLCVKFMPSEPIAWS